MKTEQEIKAAVATFAARGPWYAAHAESFERNLREIDAEPAEKPLARDATAETTTPEEWEAVLSLTTAIGQGWISPATSLLDLPVDALVAVMEER